MIYSASRRTDLPAFFPDRLADRVRRSRRLDAIVFWTRDPANLVRHPGLRAAVVRYPAIVQLTVTGLAGTAWEPHAPRFETFLEPLRELAGLLPRGAILWRFDPVLAVDDVLARFDAVRQALAAAMGPVEETAVSFPAPYGKAVRRVRDAGLPWPNPSPDERLALIRGMVERLGGAERTRVWLCCQPEELRLPGTAPARCIDGGRFDRLYGTRLGDLPPDGGQRAGCGYARSTDIGSYDLPCRHGCVYCYAQREEKA